MQEEDEDVRRLLTSGVHLHLCVLLSSVQENHRKTFGKFRFDELDELSET